MPPGSLFIVASADHRSTTVSQQSALQVQLTGCNVIKGRNITFVAPVLDKKLQKAFTLLAWLTMLPWPMQSTGSPPLTGLGPSSLPLYLSPAADEVVQPKAKLATYLLL